MDLVSGVPYWPKHDGRMPGFAALRKDIETDVAVVGGGISGALIAYELIRRGTECTLLEKHRIGGGSTSASTALLSYEFDMLLGPLSKRIGSDSAVSVFRLCREAAERLRELVIEVEDACDYDERASVRVSNDRRVLPLFEEEAKLRNKHRLPVELLNQQDLESRFGIVAKAGLVSDRAAQIDPLRLTYRLVRHASRHGLEVFERTRVTGIDATSKRVLLSTSSGSNVVARQTIFATGYESDKYLREKLARRTTDFCFISHPLKSLGAFEKCHLVEHARRYLYASTFGNRVMVGVEDGFRSPDDRRRLLAARTLSTLERFLGYAPNLKLSPAFRWAATFAKSKDSLPYFGQAPDSKRVHFVLCYGGNGIAAAAMMAPIACDAVEGRRNPAAKLLRLGR